jgi:arylsulfatase A-like enzyme
MSSDIDRREFLKILSVLPLLQLHLPQFAGEVVQPNPNPDLPNILILVFDALSAEHLSLSGYRRKTTPNIDRFAEKAIVYHDTYAGGNFTSAGTGSLLTGTYPWSHRAIHLHGTVLDTFKDKNIFSVLADKGYYRSAYSHNLLVTSLLFQFRQDLELFTRTRELCLADDQFSDLLFPNDFNTAFWSEWLTLRGSNNSPGSLFISLLHRLYRLVHKREFTEKYSDLFPNGIPNLHNLYFILEDAIDWIMQQLNSMPRPYLAYYHLLPPHEPYTTRRDFSGIFADGWQPEQKPAAQYSQGIPEKVLAKNRVDYDEYLAYADSEFGRLYDYMEGNGVLEDTIFIFTSDHGELFERGIRGHVTQTLYQPVIRVPLIISTPGQVERLDVYSATSTLDILPTIMSIIDQPVPDWCEGEILPAFNDQATTAERSIFSVEAKSNPKLAPLNKSTVSIVHGDYKLTRYSGYKVGEESYEFYDILNDPDEREDRYSGGSEIVMDLKHLMEEKLIQVDQRFS